MGNSSASVLLVLMLEELSAVFQVIFFSLLWKAPALHLFSFFPHAFPTWYLCGLLHIEQQDREGNLDCQAALRFLLMHLFRASSDVGKHIAIQYKYQETHPTHSQRQSHQINSCEEF